MTDACHTCRFYSPETTRAFPEADGMCRRYAPSGAVIGSQSNGWQVFPPMMSHQWCGDYRPGDDPAVNRGRIAA